VSGDDGLALASTAPLSLLAPGKDPLAVRSPAYGRLEDAPVVRTRTIASDATTVATFVPASAELARQLEIEDVRLATEPGPGWHGCGVRVRWERGVMSLLAAIESSGIAAQDTSSPPQRWGTAELQTDARLAAVIEHPGGGSEAILVNGTLVSGSREHMLISLSRRVPLLRLTASTVAPTMHEVGT
jgi:hypothetical protein